MSSTEYSEDVAVFFGHTGTCTWTGTLMKVLLVPNRRPPLR